MRFNCLLRGEVTPTLFFELSKLQGFVYTGGLNSVLLLRPGGGVVNLGSLSLSSSF